MSGCTPIRLSSPYGRDPLLLARVAPADPRGMGPGQNLHCSGPWFLLLFAFLF